MPSPTTTIVINGDSRSLQIIQTYLASQEEIKVSSSQRKGLDGNTAGWVLIATLSTQALPHILGFIKEHLAAKQVKRLKIDDWEVENPTPEVLSRFIAKLDAKKTPPEQGK